MTLKLWNRFFFILTLFGIIPLLLSAFNIYRETIQQANIFVFLILIWIGLIGRYIVKKLTMKNTEREMRWL